MAKRKPPALAAAEYVVRNEDGQDDQILGARWQFIKAIHNVVPAFFEGLRNEVYPEYAGLADGKPAYWMPGLKFETWQELSDRDRQLTPVLTAWARKFNIHGETWIFEGALQTLSNWHQSPTMQAELDIWGFRQSIAVPGIISDEDHRFHFDDWGWDPTFSSFASWRKYIGGRFQEALEAHQQKMRKLAKDLGALQVASRFSPDHFEWLALYQCGNLSLDSILSRATHAGDKTTISKGIHSAAKLAAITVQPKNRKLKNP